MGHFEKTGVRTEFGAAPRENKNIGNIR